MAKKSSSRKPSWWLRRFLVPIAGLMAFCVVLLPSFAIRHPVQPYLSPVAAAIASANAPTAQQQGEDDALQRGRDLYQQGQFSAAAKVWQAAATAYEQQQDDLNQALALSYLALSQRELGQLEAAQQTIARSLELVNRQPVASQRSVLAQVLNTQGSVQLAAGQAQQALETWQQAAELYTSLGDERGRVGALLNQAQAEQALGFYLRARKTLLASREALQRQTDLNLQALGLRNLGEILRSIGDLNGSQEALTDSLNVAQPNDLPVLGDVYLSLGNTAYARQETDIAVYYYRQAIARSPMGSVQAQLNQLRLLIDAKRWNEAQALQAEVQPVVTSLQPSRAAIYAQINYAQSLVRLRQQRGNVTPDWPAIAQIVATAVQQARQLQDKPAEAHALGTLGNVYEQTQQWDDALDLTQQALLLAQTINAPDIAYQWQWQVGRLLKAQADQSAQTNSSRYTGAIAAYADAINTLKTLRNDLVAVNTDVQFSFRESVEPVYRQLVDLLLGNDANQENLNQARDVIESLQLAQLDNFFRENCLNARPTQVDRLDTQAAVLYSILLDDRLEVILSLPNQPLRHYATAISEANLNNLLDQTRRLLRRTSDPDDRLPVFQKVYDALVRPAEADLAASQVKTLVFILDGALQGIPMSVLHDGTQYLIEKYSIGLAPGLQLLEPEPLQQEKLNILLGGLTEARLGFSALPGVAAEVTQITAKVPTQLLLNSQFTTTSLQNQVEESSFPIVHLATHGQFSSNAEDTFILAWDNPINVRDLDTFLRARQEVARRPIELLILSACQTAAGDRRAALGLAGIAVRSGARSTLATLWSVDDQSTAFLMVQFYQKLLQGNVTKAEALRQAQLELQKQPGFQHPYYWAPFVLVGNWL